VPARAKAFQEGRFDAALFYGCKCISNTNNRNYAYSFCGIEGIKLCIGGMKNFGLCYQKITCKLLKWHIHPIIRDQAVNSGVYRKFQSAPIWPAGKFFPFSPTYAQMIA